MKRKTKGFSWFGLLWANRMLNLHLVPVGWTRRPLKVPSNLLILYSLRVFFSPMLFQIDHFGFAEDRTFKQRYLIADQHWKKDTGSILFYTGNEGDIAWFANNTGFMWNVAEEFDAILVFAEHRYYGDSLPFGNKSYTHLNYLSSQQALADFAVLIQHLKNTIPGTENTPVIAIGGSYGGMLAAWFRMKYPHIVIGALAASAPIWQFDSLVPCGSFYKIVTEDFKKSGAGCSETIQNSWAAIKRLQWLSHTFRLCSPLKTKTDVINFREWLRGTWIYVAMVDYPYEAAFLQPLPAWPVKVTKSKVTGIRALSSLVSHATHDEDGVGLGLPLNSLSLLLPLPYSAQPDFALPQFPPQPTEPFSQECFKAWGVRPRPSWIPTFYGGKNISAHSNIIFSNGGLDPWSGGGVTKNITDTLVAIMIPEGAHHLDLRSNSPFDPTSVLQARLLEVHYMKLWLQKGRQPFGLQGPPNS
uniref:Prolylcarboxypeptidase n=1 Tax=Naja naja TaxID=35670 RepID=A0A8C6XB07_NAJNA